ncbi:MAG: hypothetical protein RXR59_06905 [Sulfolobus sp.]
MHNLKVLDFTTLDLEDAKDKIRRELKKLRNGDELILLSPIDLSYMCKGYKVDKGKEEDLWIIRVRRN